MKQQHVGEAIQAHSSFKKQQKQREISGNGAVALQERKVSLLPDLNKKY